ncbi:MAG: ribosome assembly cofactor RimP [Prevotella sp.]|nr:ribosome assembly cofactor RimP [Prevotella sp.]
MITKDTIKTLVEEWLHEQGDYFLVDIQMDGGDDRIVIEIDNADGVWIEDCAGLSRYLQERLGDDLGDYELEVGSAGLGQPFKVEQQYLNHVGDQVEVLTADGKKLVGTLKSVDGRRFTVVTQEKQVPEGKKRPVRVDVDKDFSMDEVKSVKYVLNFK